MFPNKYLNQSGVLFYFLSLYDPNSYAIQQATFTLYHSLFIHLFNRLGIAIYFFNTTCYIIHICF